MVGDKSERDAGAPSGRPPEAAAAGAPGASPSNTAPGDSNTSPQERTQLVGCGIDSLYLSIRGCLKSGPQNLLQRLKEQAQSGDPEIRALAQYPVGDWLFQVSDKGARQFSYVLTDPSYRIELSRATVKSLPMAHVQVSSAALAARGVSRVVDDLRGILSEIGEVTGDPMVSRVDLFVDATTDQNLERVEDEQWVTRAQSKVRYSDQGERSGYVIGGGGNVSLRMYKKTLEIRRSGKDHATYLWRARGWNGLDPVWRVEAQVRRVTLVEFNVRTVPELLSKVGAIWRYVLMDWCRLAVANWADRTPSRWLTDPFWLAVEGAAEFQGGISVKRKVLDRSRAPADWMMARQFVAVLTSFMAAYETFDTAWALEDLVAMVRRTYSVQEEVTGRSLARSLGQAVATKTRSFNIGAAFRVPSEIGLKLVSAPRQGGFEYDGDKE